MARLRKFCAYRSVERPYTRYSKFKKKSYVRSRPVCKVVRFDAGEHRIFDNYVYLLSKSRVQIRDNALESARQTCNKLLEKNLGKTGFFIQIKTYPHHILRENPLASGAGADRMSTGMAHSFGKVMGIAAQVRVNQPIIVLSVDKQNVELAKTALKRATSKLPMRCQIIVMNKKL